ncbi:WXG100 family type VII secretion target [Nocardioides houyundeii]|uniref:WXG100 family type VII secretion target n=1 Tax=Nocardioides houyundeii TaxID=2045452 RepID=UPI000C77C24E|nr:WXG100 family type VII secretion target [Nocardioides houyundeii]
MTAFRVDVEELRLVVAEMTACQAALDDLVGDADAVTRDLHAEWSGLARDAHVTSYARWRGEFADMTQALAGIRDLGDTAQANYTAAVGANLSMWGQVR